MQHLAQGLALGKSTISKCSLALDRVIYWAEANELNTSKG